MKKELENWGLFPSWPAINRRCHDDFLAMIREKTRKSQSSFFSFFFTWPCNAFGAWPGRKKEEMKDFSFTRTPISGASRIVLLWLPRCQKLVASRVLVSQNSLIFFSLVRIPHIKDKGIEGLMDPDLRKKKIEFCESGKLFPQKGSVNRFTFLWVQFPERHAIFSLC